VISNPGAARAVIGRFADSYQRLEVMTNFGSYRRGWPSELYENVATTLK
jgi:hypothetical protein